jgi:hypothetical protein
MVPCSTTAEALSYNCCTQVPKQLLVMALLLLPQHRRLRPLLLAVLALLLLLLLQQQQLGCSPAADQLQVLPPAVVTCGQLVPGAAEQGHSARAAGITEH